MIKAISKIVFYLFILSFTPIPLLLFLGYLFVYKDGYYIDEIKSEVFSLWAEMIVRFDLYYLEDFLIQLGIALMILLLIITHLMIMLLIRKRRNNKAAH